MRKNIVKLLTILIVACSLSACGGNSTSEHNDKEAATTSKETSRLDELKNKKEETNKEIEEKEQKEQEAKNSITTNSQLLEDLTNDSWGYLNIKGTVLNYMNFHDDGTVYFACFDDYKGGSASDKVSGGVTVGLNHGEYAIDEDKSEIIMFYPEFDIVTREPEKDGRIIESHASYKYENGQLIIESDPGTGTTDMSTAGYFLVEYINDESFGDFYSSVVVEGNKEKLSVKGFYQDHPDFTRDFRSR